MALPTEELKRRIDAARTLRGFKQRELADLLEADGLGKHDLGRIERGDLDLRRVHLDALQRHLRMPEWWFTAGQIDLGAEPPEGLGERLDGLADQLDSIEMQLAAAVAGGHQQTPAEQSNRSHANETKGGGR